MAAPSARFVIAFDTDTGGISQSKSALDGLRETIEKDTKALADMQAAMQRLKGTAEVARWEALPKDIAKADLEVKKLEQQMAKLRDAFAAAPDAKKEGIFAAGLKTSGELDRARARAEGLRKEQLELGQTAPVKAFEDLRLASEKTKASLGANQVALSRLGGTMSGAGGEVKDAAGGMSSLAEASQQIPGPIGGIVSKIQQLKALGPAAAVVAIVVALVALGAAAVVAAAAFGRFVVEAADAARTQDLLRDAAAVGSASARELDGAMLRVEGKTNAAREAVSGLVNEYSRLRLSLGAIEGATSAITVATQAAGSAAGSAIKGLIDRGVDTKRFWIGAFDLKGTGLSRGEVAAQLAKQMKIAVGAASAALRDGRVKLEDGIKALDAAVEARFGEVARRQMLALPVQLERAKKNLAGLFKGVNIEPFLEKLRDLLSLLDEGTVVGDALRQMGKTLFQPLVDGAGMAFPIVEGAIYGVVLVMQELVIMGLKVAIAVKKMFGGSSLFKDLDAVKIGFYLAMGAIGAFAGVMTGLLAVLLAVGVSLAMLTAPIWLVVVGIIAVGVAIGMIVDSITSTIDDLVTYLEDTGTNISDAVEGITDAIIKAVEDGIGDVAKAFTNMAKSGLVAFKNALGIKSPSRVFMAEARWIPIGAAKGIEEGQPAVASALASLADPADMGAPEAGTRLALAGGGGTTNQVSVNYYGSGSRSDAQQFGQWLFDELETLTLAKGRRP